MRRVVLLTTCLLVLAACGGGSGIGVDDLDTSDLDAGSSVEGSGVFDEVTESQSDQSSARSVNVVGEESIELEEEPASVNSDDDVAQGDGPPAVQEVASAPPSQSAQSSTTTVPVSTNEVPNSVMDTALEYAIAQLNVAPSDITVEQASAWSWPDTAFGCPEPGKMYSQVMTDGFWVVLSAAGETLDLRFSLDGDVKECRLPEARTP